ncbi:uncharacterized protein LOC112504286 [Cynara cardunculus var. scolymus]|uniref:uncharacterized protein LOC112504286 n=1 Tax=Cynara cardunculus var. scolymus TaxID=59895 RepID=UPI000D62FC18|nr:uncharacterized protein LOC112504286 [Cynara cardunculus var. scolymus]
MQRFGTNWPEVWIRLFPQLQNVMIPYPSQVEDKVGWLAKDLSRGDYEVKLAWKTIQEVRPVVHWYKLVWNKAYIPKHAICIWMACQLKLPTQDRLSQWKHEPPDLKCVFCKSVIESHNHLFFECTYSRRIWEAIQCEVGLINCPSTWEDILHSGSAQTWQSWSTVQKLGISATVYNIWRERNRKFFDNFTHSGDKVIADNKMQILHRMAWKTRMKLLNSNAK